MGRGNPTSPLGDNGLGALLPKESFFPGPLFPLGRGFKPPKHCYAIAEWLLGLGPREREILENRGMRSGLTSLALGTWEHERLENNGMRFGLRYLTLGTWKQEILKNKGMRSGRRYLALGTWQRKLLENRGM